MTSGAPAKHILLFALPALVGNVFQQIYNIADSVIGRFTIPFILTGFMGFGETGIWYSCGIVWFISGFTAWIRYVTFFRNKMIKYRK